MEATASVAVATRGVPLTMPPPPSQASRKEWRVVSEHPVRTAGNEDLERSKLGQSDERLIYEGREPADVDFCSITIDESSDNDILQQRLHSVVKQREDLQHLEIDIKARLIARSEVMEMQDSFDSQIKEQINANVKLQEQLHEREKTIHELERTIEEKEKELHAIRLDHEAAWAKEDLLREQNKELASFRRERDNSEAERAQHLKQIHDLQEHIQEKERQFMEIQEQHRVAQETIIYKDEQLREAQAWITRVQEMDALQSTANHSLQAELRERTEQYNQLWLGCQRQFAEMERIHLHTIQQLQLELADVRERSGTYSDESRTAQTNLKDASHFGQSNGSHLEVNGGGAPAGNSAGIPNGNGENVSSFNSTGNTSTQADHVPGVQMAPQSLLGMPTYLPSGQVTALHPFVMHQQGVPQAVPSHVPQSHVGHFHSAPAISSLQHWQNQQALSEGSQMQNQYISQNDQNSLRPDTNYDYEVSVNGQAIRPEYLDAHVSQGLESHAVVPSRNEEGQVIESIDKSYMVGPPSQQSLQQISSQFHGALRLDPLEHNNETEDKNVDSLSNHGVEVQSMTEQPNPAANTSEAPIHAVNFDTTMNKAAGAVAAEGFLSSGQKTSVLVGKTVEATLLDEESLLACVVRTIPPGGRIRISSTLPNRLGKMLAPLHWHDYKKKYGKLDDFLGNHPELFVIEGDYIQLRDGAQEIIAAMAARAKVRAAAAAAPTSAYPSLLPPVAVTPMAQSHRLKKAPSSDSKSGKLLAMQNQHANGVSFNAVGGVPSVKILSKPKDQMELNGSETRHSQASLLLPVGNGANPDRSDLGSSQNKSFAQGRLGSSFSGKQQGRSTGAVASSRR